MINIFVKQEEERFKHKLYSIKTCPIKSLEELFEKYNVHEYTEHFYDSSPEECEPCKLDNECENCKIWENWKNSKKRLSFNNWVDVYGPDMWGETQKDVNNSVKEVFIKQILKDTEFDKRMFWFQPENKKYLYLYYCNRDRVYADYWFVMEMREFGPDK